MMFGNGWERASLLILGVAAFCVLLAPAPVPAGSIPEVGAVLPEVRVCVPETEKERNYLGVNGTEKFTFDQLSFPYLLVEIAGVYCPYCHEQAPHFNTLFSRIRKNADMAKKIRMITIAAGADASEVKFMKEQFSIPFPVVKDPDYGVFEAVGEPATPFTLVVSRDRKVVYTHLGIIANVDSFMEELSRIVR
jgi:peroxiredoxin